jgi:hypothetical protein
VNGRAICSGRCAPDELPDDRDRDSNCDDRVVDDLGDHGPVNGYFHCKVCRQAVGVAR